MCQLPGEGEIYSTSASGFWGFGFFLKAEKTKVGVSMSPLVLFFLVNQCLMGFGVSKKDQANWWRILK